MTELHVFVGFDPREPLTYAVCKNSILETTPGAVVHKLDAGALRQRGIFSRPWRITAEGQFIDERDGKPFSTYFSHTRFLVPHLARMASIRIPVLFMDSDMVVLSDLREAALGVNAAAAVSVVKHVFEDKASTKMDGMAQTRYQRKLWSAFMVFDPRHPYCMDLTPDVVNTESGAFLHQFKWVPDHLIGELSPSWQFIPGHTDSGEHPPRVMHFTRGTPELPLHRDCEFSDIWYKGLVRALQ